MSKFFTTHSEIEFIKDSHEYIHSVDGDQYISVTRLLSSVKAPFDRDRIAGIMARKEAANEGISLSEAKAKILEGWDNRRDSSIDWGNWLHDNIDSYIKTGKFDPLTEKAIIQLSNFLKGYYRHYSEVKLYSYKHKVAGTGDLIIQRQSKNSVYDFYDNKTFLHCGVELDSISVKNDVIKHYNRFFLSPFEHLEQCNYNSTALQLSTYALMAELQFGIKVGKLAMLYYDNDLNLYLYPIPYMRTDAMILLELNLNRKQLPK